MAKLTVIIVVSALLGVAFGHTFVDDLTPSELSFLAQVKLEQLPRYLRLKLQLSVKTQQSGYCCKNGADKIVPYRIETKIVHHYLIESTDVSSSSSCGFLSTGRCHHHSVQYRSVLKSYIDRVFIPDKSVCPDQFIVCCANHIMIAGSCHDLSNSQIIHSLQDILDLQNDGLIHQK